MTIMDAMLSMCVVPPLLATATAAPGLNWNAVYTSSFPLQ